VTRFAPADFGTVSLLVSHVVATDNSCLRFMFAFAVSLHRSADEYSDSEKRVLSSRVARTVTLLICIRDVTT
jgi:hypothetical protein